MVIIFVFAWVQDHASEMPTFPRVIEHLEQTVGLQRLSKDLNVELLTCGADVYACHSAFAHFVLCACSQPPQNWQSMQQISYQNPSTAKRLQEYSRAPLIGRREQLVSRCKGREGLGQSREVWGLLVTKASYVVAGVVGSGMSLTLQSTGKGWSGLELWALLCFITHASYVAADGPFPGHMARSYTAQDRIGQGRGHHRQGCTPVLAAHRAAAYIWGICPTAGEAQLLAQPCVDIQGSSREYELRCQHCVMVHALCESLGTLCMMHPMYALCASPAGA
jgi:hypothetical protein